MDKDITKNKPLRSGFTTGSCSAAAAKAAAFMLLSGNKKEKVTIKTPKGIDYVADIIDIDMKDGEVSCAVIKDGGDDPDVTSGAKICVTVSFAKLGDGPLVYIDGGEGIGRVTRDGLDQPVGNAAINTVPRQMITKEVLEVMEAFGYTEALRVIISCPEGKEIAAKTFNPRLGIEGGISIIGTSGVVEPMSMQAIKDTIRLEIRQKAALGHKNIVITPGNYGVDFIKENCDFDLDMAVKCSNFIGETIDMAEELGIEKLLLVGHIGKLIKVAGGIMNTHSREADCRAEIMTACAIEAGCDLDIAGRLLRSITTTEGCRILQEEGLTEGFTQVMMDKVKYYLDKRAAERLEIECIVFSNVEGIIGKTERADEFIDIIRGEKA